MNKNYRTIVTLTFSIAVFVMPSFSQALKQSYSPILSKTHTVNDNCTTMIVFLQDSLSRIKKPGGMVIITNSCSENVTFSESEFKELTLNEKLDLIVKKNPNYVWTSNNEVINLFPSKSLPKLLGVKIRNLKISFDTNLQMIVGHILKSPEILEKMRELNLKGGLYYGGLQSPPSNRPPTEMEFHDKTLQEILNEIVKKHDWGVWLYREYSFNGVDYFKVDFITG